MAVADRPVRQGIKDRQKAAVEGLETVRARQPRDIQLLASHLQKMGEMENLGITPSIAARAIEVSERTISRWSRGERWPQAVTFERLDDLVAVVDHLRDTFSTVEAARTWLHSDNSYLGGLQPIEALSAGRLDRLEAALMALDAGIFV